MTDEELRAMIEEFDRDGDGESESVIGTVVIGARRSSVARAFAHGAMGRRIDPSWWSKT